MYVSVRETLASKPKLIPVTEKLEQVIKNTNKDYYVSLYHYTEAHKKILEDKGTLSGITDTSTNRLYFDFDDKVNPENARQDAIEVANRLIEKGFEEDNIDVNFTGSKGFSVEVTIDKYISPQQFSVIVDSLAGDLKTFDAVVKDPNRIVRVQNTKHQKSGLYKIPLTPEELIDLSMDSIREVAAKPRNTSRKITTAKLPDSLLNLKPKEVKVQEIKKDLSFDISEIDMTQRPRGMDEARWLLSNGFFRTGERNPAFLCLAATYKNFGYPIEVTRGILDGVALLQSTRTGEDTFPDKEMDLILKQVYGPNWKGGMFTTKDPTNWLYKYAVKMGISIQEEAGPRTLMDIEGDFSAFIRDIEKNTLKTGLAKLDHVMPITVGSNIGVVAAAGAGKTAFALNVLKHNSEEGILTVFASLDMHRNRLFEKVLYNLTGISREDLYTKFRNGEAKELLDMVRKHYGNVYFYDKASATVSDIKRYVQEVEAKTGQKVKMVLIDYFERVNSDVNDDTAASKKIAGEIQDMINELDIACITLCQPSKMSLGGGPDTELKSYTNIKGSSFLYQSFRGIISLSRPFYTPETKELDKYMIVNILKNDLGELDRLEYGWKGKRGEIYELEDIEREELKELMKMKNASKKDQGWE